jgi:hypothetical protein
MWWWVDKVTELEYFKFCNQSGTMKLDREVSGWYLLTWYLLTACKPCELLEERTQDVASEIDPFLLGDVTLNDRPQFPHRGHGWVQVNDTRGCCPHSRWECQQERCPKPEPCQDYYKLHELPVAKGECCPLFKCGNYCCSYNLINFLFLTSWI